MEFLNKNSEFPQGAALILGFFDGIHLGHRRVIQSTVEHAAEHNAKSVLVTFKESPSLYFRGNCEYIFPRPKSYEIISSLGVDYILENDFSEFVSVTAGDYLEKYLIKNFAPVSITTGANHTFGAERAGNPELLNKMQEKYKYRYFCLPEFKIGNETVSSTYVKRLINLGEVERAADCLGSNFSLESTVIEGEKLGRRLGFPTANMIYPENIVRMPYGTYKVIAAGKNALLNWGVKPTVGGHREGLEVYIPDFNGDLYGKCLCIDIVKKLRDEKKFDSIEELKAQIARDVEKCLKS